MLRRRWNRCAVRLAILGHGRPLSAHIQFILGVIPGRGCVPSLDNSREQRLLKHSRMLRSNTPADGAGKHAKGRFLETWSVLG
jgi:hypothetical protein